MNSKKRVQIRRMLRSLADAHAATMELLQQTLSLLSEELAIDPLTFWKAHRKPGRGQQPRTDCRFRVDHRLLSVVSHGRTCFLGNTLPFRFLVHLVNQPDEFVSYDELFSEVWNGDRSDAAVRSVVKTLRAKLRRAGMNELADAIDGSVPGHYRIQFCR